MGVLLVEHFALAPAAGDHARGLMRGGSVDVGARPLIGHPDLVPRAEPGGVR